VVPAIAQAARAATKALAKIAAGKSGPFAGEDEESLTYRDGFLMNEKGRRASIADVLTAASLERVQGEGESAEGEEAERYTFRCFGAHFVEVRWDLGIARLRVSRVVSAFDVGRVINRKTAANQIYGSILMGIGMARLEESVYDSRDGHVVTDNVADYLMPVHADTPEMDIHFLDIPDPHVGEFGARGIGEIGITGMGGAILNAIYHATGKRVRELPVRIEALL
ncbi:MAG TPA: molybdopterin cofactor-binding domain-containing protein, partial [Opitutus sp.]|nr:molybdopterin cofactor-binding domain-containing protein [Opitutus sp.]